MWFIQEWVSLSRWRSLVTKTILTIGHGEEFLVRWEEKERKRKRKKQNKGVERRGLRVLH